MRDLSPRESVGPGPPAEATGFGRTESPPETETGPRPRLCAHIRAAARERRARCPRPQEMLSTRGFQLERLKAPCSGGRGLSRSEGPSRTNARGGDWTLTSVCPCVQRGHGGWAQAEGSRQRYG